MNYREAGEELCTWAETVYGNINSGFYPESHQELQMGVFIGQIRNGNSTKGFWNLLGYTLFTIIDEEPVSNQEKKRKRMAADILLPILTKISSDNEKVAKIIAMMQKGFPSPKEFYKVVREIENN